MKTYLFRLFGEQLALRINSSDMAYNLLSSFLTLSKDVVEPADAPVAALGDNIRLIEILVAPADEKNILDVFPQYLLTFFTDLAVLLNDRFLFLHAASFVADDKVFALSGPSGAGKTTLAMTAQTLGYCVAGEDFTAIDWHDGTVHPLPLPFRPRPETRKIITGRGNELPYRPEACPAGLPLYRLFLADEAPSITQALARAILGADRLNPRHLAERIPGALQHCTITRSPVVRIDPLPLDQLAEIFKLWTQSPEPTLPPEIFAGRS